MLCVALPLLCLPLVLSLPIRLSTCTSLYSLRISLSVYLSLLFSVCLSACLDARSLASVLALSSSSPSLLGSTPPTVCLRLHLPVHVPVCVFAFACVACVLPSVCVRVPRTPPPSPVPLLRSRPLLHQPPLKPPSLPCPSTHCSGARRVQSQSEGSPSLSPLR